MSNEQISIGHTCGVIFIVFLVLYPVSSVMGAASLEYGLVKIHPDTPYQGQSTLGIHAARNEYESFQIVLDGPMIGVTVTFDALAGPTGSIPADNIRYFGVYYLPITTPSNFEGGTGSWPDALIPDRDLYFNEQRNAFPIDVPAGQNRLIWVDVFVPPATSAGDYTGTVHVLSTSAPPLVLEYSLTVWDFFLPSTTTLPTAFGFEGWDVLRGHYGEQGMHDHYDQIVPLTHRYLDAALMNRFTLSSGMHEEWDIYDDPIDWNLLDGRWRSYFEGRNLPFGLANSRITCLEIPDMGGSDAERVAFWRQLAQHFRSMGWFGLLLDYTFDEPSDPEEYQEIIHRAALVHQADPDLRVLVTTDIQEAEPYGVTDVIDIWVPIINFMHGKPYDICWDEEYVGNQRGDYDGLVAGGAELWWYQSCMSHGCSGMAPDDQCEAGYPSYMIDFSGVRNRIMGWMTYFYDIRGELYFDVNYVDGQGDAWESQYYFGGNGDGTLFYPGRPDRIGGTNHIPIESIRLKHIRDGIEDYEFFLQLERLQGRAAVTNLISQIVTNAYTYSEDPITLRAIRTQIGDAVSGSPPGLGVQLSMPDSHFSPGEACWLKADLLNHGAPLENVPLFVILDVFGRYWFWNGWTEELDFVPVSVPTGDTPMTIITEFAWPETGSQSMAGLRFWGAMLNAEMTTILGEHDFFDFGYGPHPP